MKLSRTGKTVRNLLLVLLLGVLFCAHRGFAPLTVGGICRSLGRQLLMTTPEPVYVYQGPRAFWDNVEDTFLIARSGPTWVSALYEQDDPLPGWERSWRQETSVENGPILAPYSGNLYLAGDFPAEAVTARGTAIAQHITIWHDGEGNREPPEYGESREFPLEGELLQPNIFVLPYGDPGQWPFNEVPAEEQTLAYASYNWYTIRSRLSNDNSRGLLHADIPFEITLYDAADQPLQTLQFTLDTYDLTATMY